MKLPKTSLLTLNLLSLNLLAANSLYAQELEFNTAFLKEGADSASLEAVEKGYRLVPGTYHFSVYINDDHMGKQTVRFYKQDSNEQVAPCLDLAFMSEYGILFLAPEQKKVTA